MKNSIFASQYQYNTKPWVISLLCFLIILLPYLIFFLVIIVFPLSMNYTHGIDWFDQNKIGWKTWTIVGCWSLWSLVIPLINFLIFKKSSLDILPFSLTSSVIGLMFFISYLIPEKDLKDYITLIRILVIVFSGLLAFFIFNYIINRIIYLLPSSNKIASEFNQIQYNQDYETKLDKDILHKLDPKKDQSYIEVSADEIKKGKNKCN